MITVSARDFRSNQKSYLDKVADGAEILIMRRREAFKLSKVTDDDTLMSKKEFLAKVERAIGDVRKGNTFAMRPNESLDEFMKRMKAENHV